MKRTIVAFVALAALLAGSSAARADGASADSSLDRYFGDLSDSTDTYFGRTASPTDTSGLDSLRTRALTLGLSVPPGGRAHWAAFPRFRFNRVDGNVWGASGSITRGRPFVSLSAIVEYETGPARWIWNGELQRRMGRRDAQWHFDLSGGRETGSMDRTREQRADALGTTIGAWLRGTDRRWLFDQSGFQAKIEREIPRGGLSAAYRDMVETPRAVTTHVGPFGNTLEPRDNLAATAGRAREAAFGAWANAPRLPITGEIEYRTSARAMGSDFEYRMTRAALGSEISLGRWSSIVVHGIYGRESGDVPVQSQFFAGGPFALEAHGTERLGGTRVALGRVDWIGTRDVLALAHIPHPAMFPLQLSAFAASGTAWGADPFGGPSRPGDAWPTNPDWRSEAGAAFIWQPGIPDPAMMARFGVAWPIGPASHRPQFYVALSHAMFLLENSGHIDPDR
jgi:hypothetical protein